MSNSIDLTGKSEPYSYEDFLKEWRRGEGFIARTSGSTGIPKEIHISDAIARASALRTIAFFHITPSSHLHSCISPLFIGGKMMAVRSALCGCRFSCEEPSNRPTIRDAEGGWPDLTAVVASQMLYIAENIEDIPSSARFLVGGSAIHPDLRKLIEERQLQAWESYGMTETASHIALRKIGGLTSPGMNESGWFEPLPGISLRLDERGCLVIEAPEYPEAVVTNDVARLRPDGKFQILGRADNVIISGGKKIHPESLESRLKQILLHLDSPRIEWKDMMVSSEADKKWGERLILLIESAPTAEETEAIKSTLSRMLHDSLPPHEVPKEIRFVDRLPRTANGKLLRHGSTGR